MIYSVKTHILLKLCQKDANFAKNRAKNGKKVPHFRTALKKVSLSILFIFNVVILLVNFFLKFFFVVSKIVVSLQQIKTKNNNIMTIFEVINLVGVVIDLIEIPSVYTTWSKKELRTYIEHTLSCKAYVLINTNKIYTNL